MYSFYLINWNYECPFERIGILIISIILCSTFTRVYIIFLFVLLCIEFFGTTEFHLIVCVTLFQCFQECVIRLIVKFTYYSQYFVDCIGSLLTVYANCIVFRFIFECQSIVVLYMKWANCVFQYVIVIWMRYKFLYLIFFELRKIDVCVMNNFLAGIISFIHWYHFLLRIKLSCVYIQMSMS